ncbi:phage tail tape measure protein [Afipia sp. P52-10]|uniref:phage tail tape measure protein n=1 Tax=Afipia sp. P52-10 TaxID=1429916 RepID=UPI001FCB5475|nr:hypothetical protein [Afipia sp. P52-10]
MKRNIDNLVAQNRLWDAQRVLIQGAQSGLVGVSDAASGIASGWTAVTNVLGNVWDKFGEVVARAVSLQRIDLSEQLERANARLIQLNVEQERFLATGLSSGLQFQGDRTEAIRQQIKAINEVNQKLGEQAAATARVQAAQRSFSDEALIRNLVPEIAQREQLNNQLEQMERIFQSLANDEGAGAQLKALGYTFEFVAKALEKARVASRDFQTESQKAATAAKISYDAVTAYSPSSRANIARRQAEEQYRGDPQAKQRAEEAYTLALHQANEAIREQARERLLAAEQSKQSAQLEIDLIGRTMAEQVMARANLQARQQLEQEAARNRTQFDEAEYARLVKINQELGRKAQLRAEADLRSRVQFETDTLFMSPSDQRIAQEMRNIYGSGWQSQMNSALAMQMRMNDTLRDYGSIASSSFVTFGQNIRNGQNAMEALRNAGLDALGKISDKLIQMAADDLIGRALGGGRSSGGGLFGLIGGLFGDGSSGGAQWVNGYNVAATGGVNPFPLPSYDGNVFSQGRVIPHELGGVVDRLGAFAMANGNIGTIAEKEPEAIMPLKRGSDGKLGVSASGGGGTKVSMAFNIDARGAQVGAGEEIAAALAALVKSPGFEARVAQVVNEAKRRGNIK